MEESREQAGWQEISCLAGRMHLRLPENYTRLSEETAAVKFSASPRPQEIYSMPEGDRILTFNLLDKPLQEAQVYPAIIEMQRVISHAYPESTRIRPKELQTGSARIGWFGFSTGGIKGDSIHCMFVLSMEDNMMLGSYHFPAEGMEENRKILIEMLKSIRVEKNRQ